MSFTEKITMKLGDNKLESQILEECKQYLRIIGCKVIRNNTGVGKFKNGDGPERKVRFSEKGASDIFAVYPPSGRFLAIECKRPGNKPTELQQRFLDEVNQAGGLGIVAYSAKDIRDALGREDNIF